MVRNVAGFAYLIHERVTARFNERGLTMYFKDQEDWRDHDREDTKTETLRANVQAAVSDLYARKFKAGNIELAEGVFAADVEADANADDTAQGTRYDEAIAEGWAPDRAAAHADCWFASLQSNLCTLDGDNPVAVWFREHGIDY